MSKYIKCARSTGLVLSTKLYENAKDLLNPKLLWVLVQEPMAGMAPQWQPRTANDVVQFQTLMPLPNISASQNVAVNENQGQWVHSVDLDEVSLQNTARQERDRDAETYRLIRQWCMEQDEGSEEAFINLGIHNAEDDRYQLYRQVVEQIKTMRRAF